MGKAIHKPFEYHTASICYSEKNFIIIGVSAFKLFLKHWREDMNLKIYRIDKSLFGKLANWIKTPDLPVIAQASIGDPFKNIRDIKQGNCYVLSKEDEIKRFRDPRGYDWVEDVYYVRHPKKSQTDCLIPAGEFHKYIIREQIADIISYARANLRVKELEILVSRKNSGKLGLNGVLEGLPLEGKAQLDFGDVYSAKINCPTPLKASEKKKNFVWIDDFPHALSIIDDVTGGTFSINESFDLSFGLSANAAKVFGIEIGWITTHNFSFSVTSV